MQLHSHFARHLPRRVPLLQVLQKFGPGFGGMPGPGHKVELGLRELWRLQLQRLVRVELAECAADEMEEAGADTGGGVEGVAGVEQLVGAVYRGLC